MIVTTIWMMMDDMSIGSVIIQMREAITNLCKQQNQQLQRLIAQHTLDAKTSSKTQKYYRELRKLTHLCEPLPIEDVMRAAIIIAEKGQTVYTLTGERVKGLALSLNEMLRQGTPLMRLLPVLRVFMAHSKTADQQLREDLGQLMEELAFGAAFLEKFDRAMQYFDFQERTEHAGYREQFKAFTWLLFLQARQQLSIADEFQSDYLLIAVLYLTVRQAFDFLRPRNTPQLSGRCVSQKTLVSSILQRLFQVFLIDDLSSFKRITALVDDYFESLMDLGVVRCSNSDCYDFLSPTLLPLNYRRLDQLYQRQRPPHSLDYRLLLPQKPHSLTPRRFSQLSQNRVGGEKRKNFKQKSFASHKILTFETQTDPVPVCEESQRQQQIKLPANVKVSPSNTRTPMLWAFRQSPCSPIQNYMHREVRQGKVKPMGATEEQEVLSCIRQIIGEYCSTGLEEKVHLAYNYYLALGEKYLRQEGGSNEESQHCSALLTYTLLLMVCSLSETGVDGELVRAAFTSIRQMIVTDGYYMWMVNAFFLRIADRLPSQLRQMANILDDIILFELIWQEQDIGREFAAIYLSSTINTPREKNLSAIFQRLVGKLEGHISRLMAQFNSIDNWQKIEEDVKKTIMYILLNTPQAIREHSLLIVLLCSVYLVFRTNGLPIKFNEIVTTFQQINRLKPAEYKRLVNQIELPNEEQSTYCNIIQFYNRIFLPDVKEHLPKIEQWNYGHMNPSTIEGERKSFGSGAPRHSQRYSLHSLKENRPKRHFQTEQSVQDKKQARRQQSEASPIAQLEMVGKERPQEVVSIRNETTMRSRPITSFLGCLNTEKIKSPTIIR